MKPNLKTLAAVLTLGLAAYAAYAENITISTYYPSPYGNYQELETTSNVRLASTGGNVGIGLGAGVNGTTKLELAQNTAMKVGSAYLSSGGDYAHLANNAWFNGAAWTTPANGALIQLAAQDVNIYRQTAGVFTRSVNIDSAGNVAIGTAAPAAKLDVSGRIRMQDGAANAGVVQMDCTTVAGSCYAIYA